MKALAGIRATRLQFTENLEELGRFQGQFRVKYIVEGNMLSI